MDIAKLKKIRYYMLMFGGPGSGRYPAGSGGDDKIGRAHV